MKAQFLKIAGVKSEREFYKKFPTEESFFKAFPEALKSAQGGITVPGIVDGMGMGMSGIDGTNYDGFNEQLIPFTNPNSNQAIFDKLNSIKINSGTPKVAENVTEGFDVQKILGPAGDIMKGMNQIKAQKEQMKKAKQTNQLSGIYKTLSGIREKEPERRYVRPEDSLINPNQLFPSTGVGTNVLAKNGKNIDSYQFGGELASLFSKGGMESLASSEIVDKGLSTLIPGIDDNGGATIGGALGGTAGTLIGGPIGGMVGKTAGKLLGNALDTTGKKTQKYNRGTQNNLSSMMINNGATAMHQANYSYMEDGGLIPLMEEGGELQTHWGGHAETVSQNPYLEDGGQTIMFRGNSHDESDNNGNTGIGITYGNSPVEVERGEPATKINDELVVYGNLQIPNQYVELFGDNKAKGKKFKNYIKEISKDEEKQNKFLEKSMAQLNELNPSDPFDKLKFNALKANILGADTKLKDIAEKKKIAANLQEAINTTAEEYGVEADALAKGKIKFTEEKLTPIAKNGLNIAKAGGSYSKENIDELVQSIASQKNVDPKVIQKLIGAESSYSIKAKSNKGASGIMQLSPTVAKKYGVENILNSNKPEDIKKVVNAGIDFYKTLLAQNNNDYILASVAYNGGQNAVNFVKEKLNKNNITGEDWVNYMAERRKSNPSKDKHAWQNETFNYVNKLHSDKIVSNNNTQSNMINTDPKKYKIQPKSKNNLPYTPREETNINEWKGENYQNKWIPDVKSLLENPDKRDQIISILENNKGEYSKAIQNVLSKGKTPEEKAQLILSKGTDFKPGEFHNALKQAKDIVEANTLQGGVYNFTPGMQIIPKEMQFDYTLPEDNVVDNNELTPINNQQQKKTNIMDVLSSIIPNLRPSDAQALDYNQLLGEMYALGTNQLEPVQAQSYQPQLKNPYDISLQDVLNENQADYRAQQRMVGNNPAAQAMLNAQKYAANQKVLGEQFRLNQANKDQVYSGNINTLNDARLKNLAIYDQQYDRQASARANTKATTQAALNSISSKYLQNNAANKKLQIYENLYGFRFDDQGRAINQNGLAKLNSPQITDGQDIPIYDDNGNIVGYKRSGSKQTTDSVRTLPINPEKTTETKSKKNLNGSIVKAMKNL